MSVVQIRHRTCYRYRRPVGFGEHRIMFRPRESYDQQVTLSRLLIDPEPIELRYVHDVFGNAVAVARFGDVRADMLSFESRVRLEHAPEPVGAGDTAWIDGREARLATAYDPDELPDLARSIAPRHPDPDGVLQGWVRRFVRPPGSGSGATSALEALTAMSRAIRAEFDYAQRLYGAAQSPQATLAKMQGTCRDFAVLMIEAARSMGLAARFASGYVYDAQGVLPFSGGRVGGGHTHAWARVYLPGLGWIDFDPTNGAVGAEDLVCVAVVCDPRQATPLSGAYLGAADDYLGMEVEVEVEHSAIPALKVA
jgi:transglutaminase-like putative cysteine protease